MMVDEVTDVSDLVHFLRTRLDEDELVARAAAREGIAGWYIPDGELAHAEAPEDLLIYNEGLPSEAEAVHMVRHDPERILREVDAKRRMLSEYEAQFDKSLSWQRLLRLLALPYADHPDYSDAWKP